MGHNAVKFGASEVVVLRWDDIDLASGRLLRQRQDKDQRCLHALA